MYILFRTMLINLIIKSNNESRIRRQFLKELNFKEGNNRPSSLIENH